MRKEKVLNEIKESLLKIVSHKTCPEIIFIEIDTSVSDNDGEGIVPFLNIHGSLIFEGESLDEAIDKAIKNDDYGFIYDVLDTVVSDEFEINLLPLYPHWPEELIPGDQKVIDLIRLTMEENKEKFRHVNKLFFHYVESLNFSKIIDKQ